MERINGIGIYRNKNLYMFMCNPDIKQGSQMASAFNLQDKTGNYESKSVTIEVIKE